ncbi:AMP-binding protein [Maribellus sp. CM-23]|uniref:AMP-binding protein n=1 Tax=Maribellus sp. CM-23 TaxID=2781026 RepID=UPI001F2925E3|nr:AMP-binding protein [Maribellus sp. CM-23]MCE4565106.1 AMP-binding protein [Maribellus sp. CM-23]
MKEEIKITIDSRHLIGEELEKYCHSQLQDAMIQYWEKKIYSFILDWISDTPFIVQTSSGTTGQKKEFHLSKEAMVASARKTCDILGITSEQTGLLCLPVDYIAGKMMIVRAFVSGINLLIADPTGTPDLSLYDKIGFTAMVPLQVFNLLNTGGSLTKIERLIIGGGEINTELEKQLSQLPNAIYATYGMAETCSHVALRRVNGPEKSALFTAIPGVHFEVDERGCLVIYADFMENPIVTNDLIEFIDTHTFRWLGRFDNLINSGGVKIVPEELEALLSKTTGLSGAFIGMPDAKLGSKLVLVLEQKDKTAAQSGILEELKGTLPKHHLPKEIFYVEELPRNASFKLDRNKIRSLLR